MNKICHKNNEFTAVSDTLVCPKRMNLALNKNFRGGIFLKIFGREEGTGNQNQDFGRPMPRGTERSHLKRMTSRSCRLLMFLAHDVPRCGGSGPYSRL